MSGHSIYETLQTMCKCQLEVRKGLRWGKVRDIESQLETIRDRGGITNDELTNLLLILKG